MGDASPPPKEHILLLLPLPEPKDTLDALRKKHPNITIKYHLVDLKTLRNLGHHSVPDGISPPFTTWYYFR
jgi:hypothetical protein